MKHDSYKNLIRLLVAVLFISGGGGMWADSGQAKGKKVSFSAQLEFHCLWWSEAQMAGLDPNHPPPKTTEVRIRRWEYSDPVGVPHPEVVDVVVKFLNISGISGQNLVLSMDVQWCVGPVARPQDAKWSKWSELKAIDLRIPPADLPSLRVPVSIAREIAALQPDGKWPHKLRVRCNIKTKDGKAAIVAQSSAVLPITPGD